MGNVDESEPKSNSLYVQARFIRIHPKTWENVCFLRMELVGCRHGKCVYTIDLNGLYRYGLYG